MNLYRCGGGGKAGVTYATGTIPVTSSQKSTVTLGFKPRILFVGNDSSPYWVFYNQDLNPSKQYRGGGSSGSNPIPWTTSGNNWIESIDNDGFTLKSFTNGLSSVTYFAYGFETPT